MRSSVRIKQGASTPSRAAQSFGSLTTNSRVKFFPERNAARTSRHSMTHPSHPTKSKENSWTTCFLLVLLSAVTAHLDLQNLVDLSAFS